MKTPPELEKKFFPFATIDSCDMYGTCYHIECHASGIQRMCGSCGYEGEFHTHSPHTGKFWDTPIGINTVRLFMEYHYLKCPHCGAMAVSYPEDQFSREHKMTERLIQFILTLHNSGTSYRAISEFTGPSERTISAVCQRQLGTSMRKKLFSLKDIGVTDFPVNAKPAWFFYDLAQREKPIPAFISLQSSLPA